MKRDPFIGVKIVRDAAVRREWAIVHDKCQVCGRNEQQIKRDSEFPNLLQTHHLIGGAGRSDEPCNFLRLCPRCHEVYHGFRVKRNGTYWPNLTMGMLLTAKREADGDEWDPARLSVLRHRKIPDLEPIPEEYAQCI